MKIIKTISVQNVPISVKVGLFCFLIQGLILKSLQPPFWLLEFKVALNFWETCGLCYTQTGNRSNDKQERRTDNTFSLLHMCCTSWYERALHQTSKHLNFPGA
jgi:hypothetical protein